MPLSYFDDPSFEELRARFFGRRVLVTGGTGFIGSHVVAAGRQLGAELHVISRNGSGAPGTKFWRLDVVDPDAVAAAVGTIQPHGVVHLAAAGVARSLPDLLKVNVSGLANLLTSVSEVEEPCPIVIAGSGFEYAPTERPTVETDALLPNTRYGVSKAAATLLAGLYAATLPITVLRIFSVFGPGETEPRVLPFLVARATNGEAIDLSPGEQLRDYAYVGDAAQAFWHALAEPPCDGRLRVLNFGSGQQISLRLFIETVAEELLRRGLSPQLRFGARPYRADDMMVYAPDITRFRATLGWTPQTDIRQAIATTLDFFCSQI